MTVALAVTGSNLCGDRPFSAALRLDDGTMRSAHSPAGQRGDLAGLCRDLCRDAGLTPAQVQQIVVDVGPGSYTGLRVAVTFVRFLQRFGGVAVEAVDSLALLAHHAYHTHYAATARADLPSLRVLLDARRGRLHSARFAVVQGVLHEREPAAAVATDQVLAAITAADVVVAPAALLDSLAGPLRACGAQTVIAQGIGAEAMLADGLPRRPAAAQDLEPRYLMASYAE